MIRRLESTHTDGRTRESPTAPPRLASGLTHQCRFKLEDAQWFLDEFLPDIQKTAAAIKVHLENGTRPPPVAFAMQAMRYIPARAQRPTSTLTPTTPSGSAAAEPPLDPLADLGLTPGAFLGNFHSFPTDPDPIAKPQMDDEMAAKGGAVHDVAYDLMPSVWGRGLGLRGVKAMLEAWDEWAGVEMGVAVSTRLVRSPISDDISQSPSNADPSQNVEETNAASLALVRKCGFVHVDTMRWEWPMEKGGGERTVLRHEWRNPSSKR